VPDISAGLVNGIGVVGVVVALGLFLARGWLVPKYFMGILVTLHERSLVEKDKQIDLLTKANSTLEEAIQLQSRQLGDLVAQLVATREVLESLKRVADAGTREAA